MSRPGVLVNARAGLALRDPGAIGRLAERLPSGALQLTHSAEEIAPALGTLRELGTDLLVVVGGDGSVSGTLTQLLAHWPGEALPAVALTRGGTVNTIAKSLGAASPERTLERVLSGEPPRTLSDRPLIEVEAPDRPVCTGMIFANGAAARWLALYYGETRGGVRAAISVVGRIIASAGVGGELARGVFAPAAASVEVDGQALDAERFTVMAASSIRHMGLGFQPFPSAGTDPRRFHFAITEAAATRLCRELPGLWLGNGGAASIIRHHPARQVTLRFPEPQPWSLDADVYPPAARIELRATRPLRFVVP